MTISGGFCDADVCGHVNLPHLLVNLDSLWIVGPYVEKLYGFRQVCRVLGVDAGLQASVPSYLTVVDPGTQVTHWSVPAQNPGVPSAGASVRSSAGWSSFGVLGFSFDMSCPKDSNARLAQAGCRLSDQSFYRIFGTRLH